MSKQHPPLIHEGSVKNIRGNGDEFLFFEFSDRYSVFDWGGMPDVLEKKGQYLTSMAKTFFDFIGDPQSWSSWSLPLENKDDEALKSLLSTFQQSGVPHHYLTDTNAESNNLLKVQKFDVLRPPVVNENDKQTYEYSQYSKKPTNCLVPLEVIFRFNITNGSSILKRANNLEYTKQLGVKEKLVAGMEFTTPIIEFSTKLETSDRYLTYHEALEISGMSHEEFDRLKSSSVLLALRLKDFMKDCSIDLLDGKFEFSFTGNKDSRSFTIIDSIGPDELRLTYKGTQLSKENLRSCYRNGDWHKNVEKAKNLAKERGVLDWKNICIEELNSTPPKLSNDMLKVQGSMYHTLAETFYNQYYPEKINGAWDLETLVSKLAQGPQK
jgi:phosphoribosylaminoimidazole-succinocarboxamide synthase